MFRREKAGSQGGRQHTGVAACEVTEERADGITRVIEFQPGGPPGKITEVVQYVDGVRVRTRSSAPSRSNTLIVLF